MLAIVAVLCITGTAAKAEGFVVKGGFNYSNFNPDDIGGYNAWFAGIGYQTYSWNGFALGCNLGNAISPEGYVSRETLSNAVRFLDYGIGAGVGIDFWYLQLTAKYNWMFGPVADWSVFVDNLAGLRINMATFEVALAIKF